MPSAGSTFSGYPPPTSSTTYTPNQFFDVVLPNSSRGVVRIVGYMLRRILGWSDAEGRPREPQLSFTYGELIEKANVSRTMIRESIAEAISKNFIRCIREPQPNLPGQRAVSGLYELCWAEEETYITELSEFRGFYSGNGNLTYIPNKFFDYTVREENLSVTKVVGAIIRNTIGFQTKYGMRRQQVKASFARLQALTGITSREVISEAIEEAIQRKHIVRVVAGEFVPGASAESTTSVYAVKWEDNFSVASPDGGPEEIMPSGRSNFFAQNETGRKSRSRSVTGRQTDRDFTPGRASNGPKSGPSNNLETVRKPDRAETTGRSGKRNEHGLETGPRTVREAERERFENRNAIEITVLNNNNSKPAAAAFDESKKKLVTAGFEESVAAELAERYPADRIQRQLEAFAMRNAKSNPLGLLRKSIEEDWPSPAQAVVRLPAERKMPRPRPEEKRQEDLEYESFVASEAERLEKHQPDLVREFEKHQSELLERVRGSNLISGALLDEILRKMEAGTGRQSAWRQFLIDRGYVESQNSWRKKVVNL